MPALHAPGRGPFRAGIAAIGAAVTGRVDSSTALGGTGDASPPCESGFETNDDGRVEVDG